MRIYIFKSETRNGLRAFAGDLVGSKLPQEHGPWTATGAVGPDKAPPYNFSRDAIEEAIDAEGFQLWRLVKKMEAWFALLMPVTVCTENSILIDYMTEPPNVSGDDRSAIILPDAVRLAERRSLVLHPDGKEQGIFSSE
jgi:hypothetical protein